MKVLVVTIFCLNLGSLSAEKRIVGGRLASAGQFPWQTAVHKRTSDGTYFCGGSLIHNQWILTAGQCVEGATLFMIQIGSTNLQETEGNSATLATSDYILHELYSFRPLTNDIGLIKLRLPIVYTDYIQSIRVAQQGYLYGGVIATIAGWGQTDDVSSQLSNELNYVDITIITNAECKNFYGSQVTETMTCAAGSFNQGICFGDVGSPLVLKASIGNHSNNIAIASFLSQNGCESLDPSGFTRTDAYFNWIMSAISTK